MIIIITIGALELDTTQVQRVFCLEHVEATEQGANSNREILIR